MKTRLQPTNTRAFDGQDMIAVHDDDTGTVLGHVHKGTRETPIMARDRGLRYSVGTRVERGWRYEVKGIYARLSPLNERHERERLIRLSRGFARTRKEAVAEIEEAVRQIEAAIARRG